ncbi:MAG TPA: hypothetical protein VLL77_00990 [Anaerolineales bacterium]|nr:hypothetical protein [Anaerolineales bacterium]
MNIGMLWLDTDHTADLESRLGRAAAYYAAKYGRRANLCIVHPDMVREGGLASVGEMAVRVRTDIVRDHVWVGVEDVESRGG